MTRSLRYAESRVGGNAFVLSNGAGGRRSTSVPFLTSSRAACLSLPCVRNTPVADFFLPRVNPEEYSKLEV
jgi:hypothetical protein